MRYGTSAGELKKMNKLWSEQDMFSRRNLIVPEYDESAEGIAAQRSMKIRDFLGMVERGQFDEASASRFLAKYGWSVDKAIEAHLDQIEQDRLKQLQRSPIPSTLNLSGSYSSAEEELGDPTAFYGMAGAQMALPQQNVDAEFGNNAASFFEL